MSACQLWVAAVPAVSSFHGIIGGGVWVSATLAAAITHTSMQVLGTYWWKHNLFYCNVNYIIYYILFVFVIRPTVLGLMTKCQCSITTVGQVTV